MVDVRVVGIAPKVLERALVRYLREKGVRGSFLLYPAFPEEELGPQGWERWVTGLKNLLRSHTKPPVLVLYKVATSPKGEVGESKLREALGVEVKGSFTAFIREHKVRFFSLGTPLPKELFAQRPSRKKREWRVEEVLDRYWKNNGLKPIEVLAPLPKSHQALLLLGGFYPPFQANVGGKTLRVSGVVTKKKVTYPPVTEVVEGKGGSKVIIRWSKRTVFSPLYLARTEEGEIQEVGFHE